MLKQLRTLMLLFTLSTYNADANEQVLYIIFDGSNSMWGELSDNTRKIEAAKQVFRKLDTELLRDRDLALRI